MLTLSSRRERVCASGLGSCLKLLKFTAISAKIILKRRCVRWSAGSPRSLRPTWRGIPD